MIKNGAFDRLCSALVLVAVISVSAPPVCLIMNSFAGVTMYLPLFATAAAVIFGYAAQALYANVRHIKKPVDTDMSYERISGCFKLSKAVPALLCDFIPAAAAYYGAKAYMEWRLRAGLDKYIDPNSLMPQIFFAVSFVLAAIGTVMWFFPPHRVISLKNIIPVIALMVIWNVVPGIYFTYPDGYGSLLLLCFSVCILACAFVFGQSALVRNRVTARGGAVTPGQRMRIAGYTAAVILLAVLIFGFTATVYTGISVIFRWLVYIAVGNASGASDNGGYGESSGESGAYVHDFAHAVFEKSDLFGTGGAASVALFVIFLVLVAGVILYFILRLRFNVFRVLTGFFSKLIDSILAFIREVIWAGKHMYSSVSEIEYTETKQRLQVFEDTSSEPEYAAGKRVFYRDFKRRIERCADNGERLCYAYSVLVGVWRKCGYGILYSDTPREILEKLGEDTSEEVDAEKLTRIYELIRYADQRADDGETGILLGTVCDCIRKYYS